MTGRDKLLLRFDRVRCSLLLRADQWYNPSAGEGSAEAALCSHPCGYTHRITLLVLGDTVSPTGGADISTMS